MKNEVENLACFHFEFSVRNIFRRNEAGLSLVGEHTQIHSWSEHGQEPGNSSHSTRLENQPFLTFWIIRSFQMPLWFCECWMKSKKRPWKPRRTRRGPFSRECCGTWRAASSRTSSPTCPAPSSLPPKCLWIHSGPVCGTFPQAAVLCHRMWAWRSRGSESPPRAQSLCSVQMQPTRPRGVLLE